MNCADEESEGTIIITRRRIVGRDNHEWSIRDEAWDDQRETYRLGVFISEQTPRLFELCHMLVTSKKETAEPAGKEVSIHFNVDQARWLRDILAECIQFSEAMQEGDQNGRSKFKR